jgi:DNA-binding response OmpR family regulator
MTMVWRAEDRPARVLVVEDEALIAMDLQAALCRAGCEVVGPVAGIEEAAHLAAEERLDAAVLNIGLVDGEAWSTADILVRRGVPFVFFTGYELERLPERFRGRPVLGKPFSVERLRRNDRRWDATCAYNGNQDEARLVRLDPDNNRR